MIVEDGLPRCRLDLEVQARRKLDGADHPDRIFPESNVRLADRPDSPCVQVLEAGHVVDDRKGTDVVEEPVDREIASERVFLGIAEGVVTPDQDVGFLSFPGCFFRDRLAPLAKRGDFHNLAAEVDMRQPEAPANQAAIPKESFDFLGMGIGRDVKVLGVTTKNQIPDAAADQVSLETGTLESIEDFDSIGIDALPRDRMLRSRNNDWFHQGPMVQISEVAHSAQMSSRAIRPRYF